MLVVSGVRGVIFFEDDVARHVSAPHGGGSEHQRTRDGGPKHHRAELPKPRASISKPPVNASVLGPHVATSRPSKRITGLYADRPPVASARTASQGRTRALKPIAASPIAVVAEVVRASSPREVARPLMLTIAAPPPAP